MKFSSLLFVPLMSASKSVFISASFLCTLVCTKFLVIISHFFYLLTCEAGKFKYVKNKNTHSAATPAVDRRQRQKPFQGTNYFLITPHIPFKHHQTYPMLLSIRYNYTAIVSRLLSSIVPCRFSVKQHHAYFFILCILQMISLFHSLLPLIYC